VHRGSGRVEKKKKCHQRIVHSLAKDDHSSTRREKKEILVDQFGSEVGVSTSNDKKKRIGEGGGLHLIHRGAPTMPRKGTHTRRSIESSNQYSTETERKRATTPSEQEGRRELRRCCFRAVQPFDD